MTEARAGGRKLRRRTVADDWCLANRHRAHAEKDSCPGAMYAPPARDA